MYYYVNEHTRREIALNSTIWKPRSSERIIETRLEYNVDLGKLWRKIL